MTRLSNFTCHHVHVFQEPSENILSSSEGDECAAADPPEISDAQNNCKRCRE
ncbi:unnamed protein product [Brassica oleracea var. botrytis]|uniref:Uncharacterized protein n=2 Tax=Brassica TaxID=3705 RepID=A0A3P6ET66_BRAOL|nr:unnamed protein product [Brassica napus]CDY20526.1 BnaC07g11930D [Brassica napus]VDD36835.1 unnamed protein product [Brassica oleracea]